jgi:molybdenum cofactor cytidylyltransferase
VIAGVVLAAGAGRRFGAPKQLADLGGRPMLERVLAAIAAAPLDRVFVVLGAESEAILDRVDLRGTEPVICEDWETGLSASLRTGVACADACGAESAVVVLGDQPMLSPNSIARTIEARGGVPAVRANYSGTPAHPVLLERELFARVDDLRGDAGARALLTGLPVREVDCDGLGSPADVDTPSELEAVRERASFYWLGRLPPSR